MNIMIKKALFLLLFIPFSQVNGQTYQFAIRFNPIISWFNPENKTLKSDGNRIGIDGGVDIDRFFADRYAISTGISIGGYGGQLKNTDEFTFAGHTLPASSSTELKLKYLSIPIGLKFKTEEIGYSTFYAQIGLSSQYCLSATAISSLSELDGENVIDEINRLNIGYQIGGGVEYALTRSTALVAGLIYTSYFTDVISSSKYTVTSSNIALRLGIRF